MNFPSSISDCQTQLTKAALMSPFLCLFLFGIISSQQIGTSQPETHPSLSTYNCTSAGCTALQNSVVLDANWRWVHNVGGYTNCYQGNTWNTAYCPDPVTCAQNCALEGVSYQQTYGITTSGTELNLQFVTGSNVGSRVYLMSPGSDSKYQMFKLLNKEFSFDVDVSNLPCGLNGALYFTEMPEDGGLQFSGNKAGAKYGTGYCDAQCPQDIKWINGQANILQWAPSPNDPNSGTGFYGSCCEEMDIWEANSMSQAYTAHPCNLNGPFRCNSTQCGAGSQRYQGICDKDGCDFNPYRNGNITFYGPGLKVDTTKPFTVITQFIAQNGQLTEIKRLWKQNGVVIQNPTGSYLPAYNSITEAYCDAAKPEFGDQPDFQAKGGLTQMGQSLNRGVVLVMSLWDDYAANMLWLDSNYPVGADPKTPGVSRGSCPTTSGVPSDVEKNYPNANVKFSNIKFGDIGTTY